MNLILNVLQSKWIILIIGIVMAFCVPFTYDLWQKTPTVVNLIILFINVISVIIVIINFLNKQKLSSDEANFAIN